MKLNKLNFYKGLVFTIFVVILVFQLTTLKLSLNLILLSRIVNILFTIFLFTFVFYSFFKIKLNKRLFYFYLFPGLLICLGFVINIIKSSFISTESFGYFSQVFPWITLLIIPFFVQKNIFNLTDYWELFSKFLFFTTILSLIEYFLALNGNITLNAVESANGDFLTGKFAIFHRLSDGTPHFRFYSCFMEPGTYAMFLLPVICHSYYYKKYLRLALFLGAFYFTFSLGGMISLFIMALLILLKFNGLKKYLVILTLLVGGVFYYSVLSEELKGAYDEKGNSATEREESFSKTTTNFWNIILNYPFGIPLKSETSDNQKNEFYIGTNFMPGVYLQFGGYIGFLGYISFLAFLTFLSFFLYLFKKNLTIVDLIFTISLISILPFIFQRYTIIESSVFSFLFSPYLINYLKKNR